MDKLVFITILEIICLFLWTILYYLMFNYIKNGYLSILVYLLPIISLYIHHVTIKNKIINEDREYFTEVVDKEIIRIVLDRLLEMSQQFHELLIELDAVEVHQAAIFSHVRNKKFFLLFFTLFYLLFWSLFVF